MGHIAKNLLKAETEGDLPLHATVRVPQAVPFSCTIDGVQSTTHCTVGNQRLSVKSCRGGIRGSFSMDNRDKVVEVSVRKKVFEDLKKKLAGTLTNEELAEEILQMPENKLFSVTSFEPSSNLLNNEKAGSDFKTAKNLLVNENLTLCIVKNGKDLFESRSHGVTSFLVAAQELKGNLEGACVADKVVGKAIAFLCIHFKIGAVFADTLSRPAKSILEKRSIHLEYNDLVRNILNADRTNLCRIERLVRNVQNPDEAYKMLTHLRGPNLEPRTLPKQE
jgi:hypothetical protein